MYKVTDLEKALVDFEGIPIMGMRNKPLTLKTVLMTELGSYQGREVTGDQLVKAFSLGAKIYESKDDVELDDEQLKFIKLVITKIPLFTALVIGQVILKLDALKKVTIPPVLDNK